jgi:hypothetical protein
MKPQSTIVAGLGEAGAYDRCRNAIDGFLATSQPYGAVSVIDPTGAFTWFAEAHERALACQVETGMIPNTFLSLDDQYARFQEIEFAGKLLAQASTFHRLITWDLSQLDTPDRSLVYGSLCLWLGQHWLRPDGIPRLIIQSDIDRLLLDEEISDWLEHHSTPPFHPAEHLTMATSFKQLQASTLGMLILDSGDEFYLFTQPTEDDYRALQEYFGHPGFISSLKQGCPISFTASGI